MRSIEREEKLTTTGSNYITAGCMGPLPKFSSPFSFVFFIFFDKNRYGTFENVALIDNDVKAVQFSYNETAGHTIITVPHFWYDLIFIIHT